MEMRTKTGYGSFRYGIFTVCILTAGWLSMSVRADDKSETSDGQMKKTVVAKKGKQLFYPALTEREEKIQSALQSDTEANFPEIPLSEVMTYFTEIHKVPISIQAKDLGDIGITRDEPIDVNLSNLSFKNALLQILDPIDLTYVVDREMILITSKEKAAKMMKTRVYPVGDLCSEIPDYMTLEDVLRNANLGKWEPSKIGRLNSGYGVSGEPVKDGVTQLGVTQLEAGKISVLPQSKSLVISQTYHAHNAIVELLTQLRQARADQQGTSGQNM